MGKRSISPMTLDLILPVLSFFPSRRQIWHNNVLPLSVSFHLCLCYICSLTHRLISSQETVVAVSWGWGLLGWGVS